MGSQRDPDTGSPSEKRSPESRSDGEPRWRRPRPALTHDNRFFWEGVQAGKLLIQRCTSCHKLRHPPGSCCPWCRSLVWDSVEAGGRGHVFSYAVHHHPKIPPFETPHPVALSELEQGRRLVSDRVGVDAASLQIGMAVEVEFNAVDEALVLPQFRPVRTPVDESDR